MKLSLYEQPVCCDVTSSKDTSGLKILKSSWEIKSLDINGGDNVAVSYGVLSLLGY